ncbi:MAG: LemA family protein [Saprospiraceae bacterium]|jgi:LemA protein|nr:LemA family protein [Saprospiraceae bacterium]MBK7797177.1 LemA family protein [Saprospiraceae bacterium]MBK8152024.1 LemA family protein [Saprospiraceae bacterium]MBK9377345.1 LemA family protein [Saprospiraceae bacterium]MBL0261739.1 LemA family protein [Saprospiraceae bacterium]
MMYLLLFVGAIALIGMFMYNGLIKSKVKVDNAWSDISVFLKKRYDLIPNLVNTVKGYAKHEAGTLEKVIAARNQAVGTNPANVGEVANSQAAITSGIRSIFALSESYPDLKANTNFIELQKNLQDIENDLSGARRYYNATVRDYNTSIQSVPQVVLANMFDFEPREFFELDQAAEAQNIKVEF